MSTGNVRNDAMPAVDILCSIHNRLANTFTLPAGRRSSIHVYRPCFFSFHEFMCHGMFFSLYVLIASRRSCELMHFNAACVRSYGVTIIASLTIGVRKPCPNPRVLRTLDEPVDSARDLHRVATSPTSMVALHTPERIATRSFYTFA